MTSKTRTASYLPLTAGCLLLLTLLCRGMGYIYSTMATDIAYGELTVSMAGIAVEVLTILHTVTGYTAILYAIVRWDTGTVRSGASTFLVVLLMNALDCFSRFLVDSATSSITNMEKAAALWLLIQFGYSTILLLLCWRTGTAMRRRSLDWLLTVSVLYLLVSRLLLEGYYIVDFITTYTNITAGETSSMVGQLLYTLVLYGGVAWVASMAVSAGCKGFFGNPAD